MISNVSNHWFFSKDSEHETVSYGTGYQQPLFFLQSIGVENGAFKANWSFLMRSSLTIRKALEKRGNEGGGGKRQLGVSMQYSANTL